MTKVITTLSTGPYYKIDTLLVALSIKINNCTI